MLLTIANADGLPDGKMTGVFDTGARCADVRIEQ
jgi:hypothetical protein